MMNRQKDPDSVGVCPECHQYSKLSKTNWGMMCSACESKIKQLQAKPDRGAGIG